MSETYTFHVKGMHCKACVVLTQSDLPDVSGVSRGKASLDKLSVEVSGDFKGRTGEEVARDLSEVMKPHGYSLSLEKEAHAREWSDFKIAIPLALAFVALFILLQKAGIVNLITTSDVGFSTAFLIGLIASVSTCMAVVGGLVLSMSANFAKEAEAPDSAPPGKGDRIRPQIMFHASRLVAFLLLGGLIGVLGSVFQFGGTGTMVLNLLIAVILLILGINLLDIFPWAKKLQPTLPGFIGKRVHSLKRVNHTLTPVAVGVATFFLPCGFTQSMQIFALTTGSFTTGALTMFAFALGTLPVLAALSFSSLAIRRSARSGIFFKTAGLVVIFFGVFNLINSLAVAGIVPPLFNF